MVTGFLWGVGFLSANALLITALLILISLKRNTASRKAWKHYLAKLMRQEKYEEAAFVNKLLLKYEKQKRIPLPRGYIVKTKMKIDETTPFGFKIKKMIKNNKGKA